jgi:hypothetical protein
MADSTAGTPPTQPERAGQPGSNQPGEPAPATGATGSGQPAQRVPPAQPAQNQTMPPRQPAQPVGPMQPLPPTQATDPMQPVPAAQTTAPMQPVQAAQPTRPIQPAQATGPVQRVARVEPVEDTTPSNGYRTTQVILLILGFLETLLILRLLLKLFAANPYAGFTILIYGLTYPFVAIFAGVFPTPESNGSVLELSTVLAIVVYVLLAWGIIRLIAVVRMRRTPPDTG